MRKALANLPPWAWKAGVGALLGAAALWYWVQPKSFEECVLVEMRGQIPYVLHHVESLCKKRFPETVAAAPDVPWAPSAAGLPPGFVINSVPVSGEQ